MVARRAVLAVALAVSALAARNVSASPITWQAAGVIDTVTDTFGVLGPITPGTAWALSVTFESETPGTAVSCGAPLFGTRGPSRAAASTSEASPTPMAAAIFSRIMPCRIGVVRRTVWKLRPRAISDAWGMDRLRRGAGPQSPVGTLPGLVSRHERARRQLPIRPELRSDSRARLPDWSGMGLLAVVRWRAVHLDLPPFARTCSRARNDLVGRPRRRLGGSARENSAILLSSPLAAVTKQVVTAVRRLPRLGYYERASSAHLGDRSLPPLGFSGARKNVHDT